MVGRMVGGGGGMVTHPMMSKVWRWVGMMWLVLVEMVVVMLLGGGQR